MEESPNPTLSLIETRILGSLCEKESTTPDYYPMSLNALLNACNQKSNRSPVLDLDEDDVLTGLETLRQKGYVLIVSQAVARVPKYQHCLEKVHPVTLDEKAILTELLLRGPQTPGELRGRCLRMCPLGSTEAVGELLENLCAAASPLVVKLPRQPGKKDSRYAHTLSGTPEAEEEEEDSSSGPTKVAVEMKVPEEVEARLHALEDTVKAQAQEIESLKNELTSFKAQFE